MVPLSMTLSDLTRISRSRHFWSRISENRRVWKAKLLLHKRELKSAQRDAKPARWL